MPIGNKEWKVKNGKVLLETPAVEATSEEVPVARLDRQITRAERQKERAQAQLDQAQAEFDEAATHEAELKALRAQLPE
jgi:hypothetical protein